MSENDYLEQVKANQQRVAVDLKAKMKRAMVAAPAAAGSPSPLPPPAPPQGQMARMMAGAPPSDDLDTGRYRLAEEAAVTGASEGSNAVEVRITGWWRFKTVIVPPNAHVVHTRRGHEQPLHIGLGVSFGFNPGKDSFLVVPGTMQTILINAYCICRELQGLLVQGYVQWIIADFATAYKKLDFTDVEDPMRVVNVQLREQAEAAIKDKVATMGIDEVLSDKQPIIEELTARLRSVAEGAGGPNGDQGLGLRIVTVQIKEAVVSSKRVWETLQKPFRAERARVARLAEIETETAVSARERAAESERERAHIEAAAQIATLRSARDAEAFDRQQAEAARREQREQEIARQTTTGRHETALHAAELEKVRVTKEAEAARVRAREAADNERLTVEGAIAVAELQRAADNRQTEAELGFLEARERLANATSATNLQARLIEALPVVAEKLPKPAELRAISIGGGGGGDGYQAQSLASLVAQVVAVIDALRGGRRGPEPPAGST
jgi:hypothetical protein